MYVYINDLSMNPNGCTTTNSWPLLKSVMDISSKLKEEYLLEKVRVPNNFRETPIANSLSINDFLGYDELEPDKSISLVDFLANHVEEIDDEIKQELDKAQINKVFYTYCTNLSSDMLTEAHIMQAPVISFATSSAFKTDILQAELKILTEAGKETSKNISLKNFYKLERIKNNALEKPIWNNSTSTTLTNIDFPQSISKKIDKKAELLRVGSKVAEMNGWIYDSKVTNKNKNSGQLRFIFRSLNSKKQYYLSIDFEKAHGAFELHDYNGKHLGEIDFKGTVPPKNPQTSHDIKIR
jgi:DUF971 family protein